MKFKNRKMCRIELIDLFKSQFLCQFNIDLNKLFLFAYKEKNE